MDSVLSFVKKSSTKIPDKYDPQYVEEGWYDWWEKSGFFAVNTNKAKVLPYEKRFTMVLPPPNVTGSLHIGHALTIAIQDCLVRWKRMCGYSVLWIPGTDHAGIATQSVVEKRLYKDFGLTKNDVGREELVKKIWDWKDSYSKTICNQIRKMGASLDWSNEFFTLDKIRSKAVDEAFVRFHKAGILYREARMVSFSPKLATVVSDIEVDVMEILQPKKLALPGYDSPVEFGYLWIFKYQVSGTENFITVATSRIETMLGDVAVAVNPKDSRYTSFVGKKLIHPFLPSREIVVVADETVDIEYGTGAVKITPAHDKHDFEIAKRHNLPIFSIFDMHGCITSVSPEFDGMYRFKCRELVEKRLLDIGHLLDKIPNTKPMQIPICSRSGDVIEYTIFPQWWVDCKSLAKRAIEAVERGELEILPQSYIPVWTRWLENIQDWCISRQLWWGHQIPAYQIYCNDKPTGRWIIAQGSDLAQEEFNKIGLDDGNVYNLVRDEDVLDTWFSSGLLPLSSLGWPDETLNLELFFPTTFLETGNDILFFWVARMVMMSLQLVDKLPFKKVYLHPLVKDSKGEKMSKSKGNVIDPLEVIDGVSLDGLLDKLKTSNLPNSEIKKASEEIKKNFPEGIPPCGADALRLSLLELTRQNRAICMNVSKIVASRHFCNKLWNAVKVLNNYKGEVPMYEGVGFKLEFEDEWILDRLNFFSETANKSLEDLVLSDYIQSIYQFWLNDFCDVYLEVVKPRLIAGSRVAAAITLTCMERGLRLLHPVMPYITEQLYFQLPLKYRFQSISLSTYPQMVYAWNSIVTRDSMVFVKDIVHSIRSLVVVLGIDQIVPKICYVSSTRFDKISDLFLSHTNAVLECIKILSKFDSVLPFEEECKGQCVTSNVNVNINIHLKVSHLGKNEVDKVKIRLNDKKGKTEQMLNGYYKKINSPNYDKVPESVKQVNDEKIKTLTATLSQLDSALTDLEDIACGGND